jgi:sec-independent protein translocase protein TatC
MAKKSGDKKKDMSFLDHLEALRWHILRSMVAILIVAIVVFVNKTFVFDQIILAPKNLDFFSYRALCKLSILMGMGDKLCLQQIQFSVINLDMAGQFLTHLKISAILGFIVAFPYVFWEFWRFVKPALYEKEKKSARGLVAVCSLLFGFGVLFGYFLITPFSINFLGSYHVSSEVTNTINLGSYISVISMISLASGIIFELPVVAYLLSKLGILTPDLMKKYRKHAFVITLVLAAMITPPDVTSQIIIAVPILVLYEVSIRISARVQKQLEKEME